MAKKLDKEKALALMGSGKEEVKKDRSAKEVRTALYGKEPK